MKNIVIALAIVFAVIGLVFTILPMGTLALLPDGIALALSVLALFLAKGHRRFKTLSWVILAISAIAFLFVIGKSLLVKDKVAADKQFEQRKEQSEKEDLKDLENLQ